jgi:hypothetical protein
MPGKHLPHSCASSANCTRGAPRKITAPALTKAAKAIAPAIPSMIATGMASQPDRFWLAAVSNSPR